MLEIRIKNNEKSQRLDKFLLKYFNNANKSFIYKMLRKKRIKLNNKKANGNEIIEEYDLIQVYLSKETINKFKVEKKIKTKDKNFIIIYEDNNILICSKPPGLVSQPSIDNKYNSLNDQLLHYLYKNGEYILNSSFKPSICNRLDKDTSGIVVLGKNLHSTQALNKAFRDKEIDKYYLTAVKGIIKSENFFKMYYLNKEKNKVNLSKSFVPNSKEILTKYKPLKVKNGYTLLEVQLITGKTHQIRASFSLNGYPILGDKKYGDKITNLKVKSLFSLNNQFLHCHKIIFNQKNTYLDYLYRSKFTCNNFSPCFKNVLNYFDY